MNALEKLTLYRDRLTSWKRKRDAKAAGYMFDSEPKPEDFNIRTPGEKIVAERIRKEMLSPKA